MVFGVMESSTLYSLSGSALFFFRLFFLKVIER